MITFHQKVSNVSIDFIDWANQIRIKIEAMEDCIKG